MSPAEEFLSRLAEDAAHPSASFLEPTLWKSLETGGAPPEWLRPLASRLFPLVGGTGRNALFSKVSNLEMEHAKTIFQQLYDGLMAHEEALILPRWDPRSQPSWFGLPLTVKPGWSRDALVQWLEKANIETRGVFGGNVLRQPTRPPSEKGA